MLGRMNMTQSHVCRPVVDANGVDHDDGMHAFTVEKSGVVRKKGTYVGGAPGYVMAQVHKDKDMFNIVVRYLLHSPVAIALCSQHKPAILTNAATQPVCSPFIMLFLYFALGGLSTSTKTLLMQSGHPLCMTDC